MKTYTACLRLLAVLLATVVFEKLVFAAYHAQMRAGLGFGDLAGALGSGLRFDLAVVALFGFGAVFFGHGLHRLGRFDIQCGIRAGGYVAAAAVVILHGSDLLYFAETGRHMGYELKEAYNSGGELLAAAFATYRIPVLTQLVILAGALVSVHRALPAQRCERQLFARPTRRWQRFLPELRLVSLLVLAAIAVRGGLQSVPLEPLHAQELGDPRKAALALNGVYNAVFSLATPYAVEPVIRAEPTEAQRAVVRALLGRPETFAASATPRNVIIVLLESWTASHMGSYGSGRDTTPRFDTLRGQSFTTRDMLAGGHRTTEGMFATFCSAQNPLGATVAQTQLQNYRYDCLPKLLRDGGYYTAFFQGTVSGTSGTGAFAQLLGFEHSYGKEHITTHRLPHNAWGLHDPDLYTATLERMAAMPTPFLVGINTNSTHDGSLPPGENPAFGMANGPDRYDSVLRFADAAFGQFVAEVQRRFPGTLIVALADHTGPAEGETINRYRIPFIVHAPGLVAPQRREVTATQRDVAPTVLALLGQPVAPWFTGRPLLAAADAPHSADYYHAGVLGWVEGDSGVEFPVRNPGQTRCFDARNRVPAACTEADTALTGRALAFTQIAQQLLFSGRLREFANLRAP